MRKLLLCLIVVLASCGTQPRMPAPASNQPDVVFVPVAPQPTNMDVLRVACWYANDRWILSAVEIVDNHWYGGLSYAQQRDLNYDVCVSDDDCLLCWDAVTEFVYRVAH